jgi:hypothetical protein
VVKGPSKLANYSFPEVDRLHHRYERRAANFVAAAPTRPFWREEPFCCRRFDSNGAKNSKALRS